jgi:hypothetical protein
METMICCCGIFVLYARQHNNMLSLFSLSTFPSFELPGIDWMISNRLYTVCDIAIENPAVQIMRGSIYCCVVFARSAKTSYRKNIFLFSIDFFIYRIPVKEEEDILKPENTFFHRK